MDNIYQLYHFGPLLIPTLEYAKEDPGGFFVIMFLEIGFIVGFWLLLGMVFSPILTIGMFIISLPLKIIIKIFSLFLPSQKRYAGKR